MVWQILLALAALAALLGGVLEMVRDRRRASSPFILVGCASGTALTWLVRAPGWQVDATIGALLVLGHALLLAVAWWDRRHA